MIFSAYKKRACVNDVSRYSKMILNFRAPFIRFFRVSIICDIECNYFEQESLHAVAYELIITVTRVTCGTCVCYGL